MSMPSISSSGIARDSAVNDVIESVALEQAALSHILNAEGEKMQKIIGLATTCGEMVQANKSVESMVESVAQLELFLESKLKLFNT